MKIFAMLLVMTVAQGVMAQQSISFEDGAKLDLLEGRLSLSIQDKTVWKFNLKDADRSGTGSLTSHTVKQGAIAIHATFTTEKGGTTEAVFLRQDKRKKLKPIWQEFTGLKGDIGEQIGIRVRFEDLSGDGVPEIVIGYVSQTVRLCGIDELPLLFRKVFDLKSKRFKPILAKRPGIDSALDIEGSLESSDPTEPIVRHVTPNCASRIAGDQGEPILLAPPGGISDQDSSTAWMPIPRNGVGEFVTMEVMSRVYGVTNIGIRSFMDTTKPNSYDRPKTVLLKTAGITYRLVFPENSIESPDQMVWFKLKEPTYTSCLSLVIESSFTPSKRRKMAIAELTVITEADGPDGLKRLAGDLLDPEKRRQAALLLDRAGKAAVAPIRDVWDKLDWQGKKRAVSVIAQRAPRVGSDILVRAMIEGDPDIAPTARRGLVSAGEAAVPHLQSFLTSEVDGEFEIAVDTLASIGGVQALKAMASRAGTGSRKHRAFLRARLGLTVRKTPRDKPSKTEVLWTEIENSDSSGNMERTLDLLRVAVGIEELTGPIIEMIVRLFESSDNFADRYRFLDMMAQLGCNAPFVHLDKASQDKDKFIRAIAMKGLGTCIDHNLRRRNLVIEALDDPEPTVRLAALDSMLSSGFSQFAAGKIAELALGDVWTDVRKKSVANTRHLNPKEATVILEKTQIDPSEEVRVLTVEAAIPIPGKRIDKLIESRLKDPNERPVAKKIAAFAAGMRCQKTALPFLFEVLKKGAEPLASDKSINVAKAAAKAMGDIGTDEALDLLYKAKRRSNPSTDKAIEAAIKLSTKRCTRL